MSELRRRGGRLRRRPQGHDILVPATPRGCSMGGRGVSMAGSLLLRWRWGGAKVCIELTQRAVSPFAMLFERLRLHHLTAVATHHQVEVIVPRIMTKDGHICRSIPNNRDKLALFQNWKLQKMFLNTHIFSRKNDSS